MTSKEWKEIHPIRWKRFQIKSRKKNRKPCNICHKNKKPFGKWYCRQCDRYIKPKQRKRALQLWRAKISLAFVKFKEKLGCKDCGYKKCGACLDFHHIDPKLKERRINAMLWHSKSKLFKREIKICVLVCKNCHYLRHYNPI